jgi:UDP-glucose 4-epimerase
MRVLVAGGAGYIGAHMCKLLAAGGHDVTVIDNLATGHRRALRWGRFVEGSLLDDAALDRAFAGAGIEAVFHFAALSIVDESVREPLRFYQNNLGGTLGLVGAMKRHGVRRLVFSSTASVYGAPQYAPIDERHPTAPVSPYGHSKLMCEQILRDEASQRGIDAVSLRYFNAAGADADGEIGEAHDPETHLVPLLLKRLASQSPAFNIYGDDYPTPDGTAIRDYVHVEDLCAAHLLALDHLARGHGGFHAFNLGSGAGYSVREVIAAAERVTGRRVGANVAPRRAGDPAQLIASSAAAEATLGWRRRYTDLHAIIETAWRWHAKA